MCRHELNGCRRMKPHAPRDLTKAGILDLVDDLADPNLTLRMQATDQLVHRDKDAVAELVGKVMQPRSNAWQRVHGLWVLERIGRVVDNPRPFVRTNTYFGPDRRRKADPSYTGPMRRSTDV